jgi:hypothetical protein
MHTGYRGTITASDLVARPPHSIEWVITTIFAGPEQLETGWWDGGICAEITTWSHQPGTMRLGILRAGRTRALNAPWVVQVKPMQPLFWFDHRRE